MTDPSDEDRKLLTLARSARARVSAHEAAALRDETGRTYVGAEVLLPSLQLSAVALCVAQAVAAGSTGVEAAVVVTSDPEREPDLRSLADLGGAGVPVLIADARGSVQRTVAT